jgi:peroxiredoxin
MYKRNFFRRLMPGVMIILLILTVSCSETQQTPVAEKTDAGRAHDFVLKDLAGAKFMLSEQKGKPVLLIFSTTWCPTCRSEIPHYKHIFDTYNTRGLVVVNIDIQESKDKVARFAEKYQLPYPMLLDEKGHVAEAYQIVGVPTLILIDQNGKMISRQYQAIDRLLTTLFKG